MLKNGFAILWVLLLIGCKSADSKEKRQFIVAAAASTQYAMEEIAVAFEQKFQQPVSLIISSTGKHSTQIRQGAPYSILVAADTEYPDYLYQNGNAVTPPKVYGYGNLVLWSMILSPQELSEGLSVLNQPAIKKIAIANPKTAPYGQLAATALGNCTDVAALQPKLVYGESIAVANQYILTKNCEIGITARSTLEAPALQKKGVWTAVPVECYQPLQQSTVITTYGDRYFKKASTDFFDFLTSPEAAAIWQQYGLRTLEDKY